MKEPIDYDIHLRRYAYHLTRDKSKINDLIQSTYLKAYSNLSAFDGKNMKSWLFTIMTNIFINEMRIKHRIVYTNLNYDNRTSSDSLQDIFYTEVVHFINSLPDRQKLAFKMQISGYSGKEISKEMKINHSTVRTLILNAKNKLRLCVTR